MTDQNYSKRELDHHFTDIKVQLNRIELQTTKHNGRLTKVERTLLIIGTATSALLLTNGSQFVKFVMSIIA